MNKVVLFLALWFFLYVPASSAFPEYTLVDDSKLQPSIADQLGGLDANPDYEFHKELPPPPAPPPVFASARKPSFAMRHPKLHKAGRKVRRTCQILLPIAEFGGACAQIASLFVHF